MVAMLVRPGAPCLGLSIRSMLYLTAAASSGSPLWNLIPRRSLNCHVVSLSRRQDSARLPSSLSVLRSRRSSVSKICRSGSWAFLSQGQPKPVIVVQSGEQDDKRERSEHDPHGRGLPRTDRRFLAAGDTDRARPAG